MSSLIKSKDVREQIGGPSPSVMRYTCYTCHKFVTSELPGDSIIRAILICPECIDDEKIIFPELKDK